MMYWSMMEEGDQDHEKSPRHSAQLQSLRPAELLVQDPLYIFSSERHVRQKCVEVSSSVVRVSSQLRNSLGIPPGWPLRGISFSGDSDEEHFVLYLLMTPQTTYNKNICSFLVSLCVTVTLSPLQPSPVFTQSHGHPGSHLTSNLGLFSFIFLGFMTTFFSLILFWF